jgi:hypothetical protein
MSNRLLELFDESTKSGRDLITSATQSLDSIASGTVSTEAVLAKIDMTKEVVFKVDYSDFSNFVSFNSALDYFNISGERMINEYPASGSLEEKLTFLSESDPYQRYLIDQWPRLSGTIILDINQSVLRTFIAENQAAAADYDRNNTNLITNLVPAQYMIQEDERNTVVLRNLLYLLARQFDYLKVAIDSFPKSLISSYTGFNEAPDALLEDALKFWGWDPKGSFLSKTAIQYFFGENIINEADHGADTLDTKLFEIKNEFWRRTLQNLMYIYKRKGTREAVEALFRVYGLDEKIVKLKEFGYQPEVGIQTRRINSERSATSVVLTGTVSITTLNEPLSMREDGAWSVNTQIRFPPITNDVNAYTGSIFHITDGVGAEELRFSRLKYSNSGTLSYYAVNSSGTITSGTWNNVNDVFNGDWYTLTLNRFLTGSGNLALSVQIDKLNEDTAIVVFSGSVTGTIATSVNSGPYDFALGRSSSPSLSASSSGSELWVRNVQVWSLNQSTQEINDHVLNPFSYGADSAARAASMSLRWESDQDKDNGAGEGRCFNSSYNSGVVNTLASGNYVVSQEILATNYLAYASELYKTASWAESNPSSFLTSSIAGVDPFSSSSTTTAVAWGGGTSSVYQDVMPDTNMSMGDAWTFSIWVKFPIGRIIVVELKTLDGLQSAITNIETNATWQRVSASITLDSASHTAGLRCEVGKQPLESAFLGVMWGAQLEPGSIASTVYNRVLPSSPVTDTSYSFGVNEYYRNMVDYNFIAPIDQGWNEEKIRALDATKTPIDEIWNDNNVLSIEFNLIDALNEDITLMMSSLDNWNNALGAPANRYRDEYPDIESLRRQYFTRLTGRINFRVFADFLDFFDRSFVDMTARLLPARANFKGAEFVVESHMLERPKVQQSYRRADLQLVPEGRIIISSPYPPLDL